MIQSKNVKTDLKGSKLIWYALLCFLLIFCNNKGNTERAVEKYELGQFSECINLLNESISNDSTDVVAYQYRGLSYYKLKQYDNAQKDFKYYLLHAITFDTITIFQIGKFFYETKQYKHAILNFDYIEEEGNRTNNYYIYHYRGNCYLQKNEIDSSLNDFRIFYQLAPKNYIATNDLAYYFNTFEKYDSAIYYYTKSIEYTDDNPVLLYYNRGTAYLKNEQYVKAVEDYLAALKIDNSISDVHLNLGVAYHFLKLDELACQHFTIANNMGEEGALENMEKCCKTKKKITNSTDL